MGRIRFDFNNMFSATIGRKHGVTEGELKRIEGSFNKAHAHIQSLISDRRNRINIGLEWARLPFQDEKTVKAIQYLGEKIASSYENVISLGIGGSYLGLKAAQDALRAPYYNEFSQVRNKRPRIYFEGNNLDPHTLTILLKNLDPKKTSVIVISKSGETTETRAAFTVLEEWLKKGVGRFYGRHIFAITDPESGALRQRVREERSKDILSFQSLTVMKGVGGRFSELNIGLLHLAIIGVNIREVLDGAKEMAGRCSERDLYKNPAAMYAALQAILYRKKKKPIAVIMPFSETLKSTADWYVQLLAESLGKKYRRKIRILEDGRELWDKNERNIINVGRTPVPSRGTGDLHSIQQNNIEGENNKTVTFIKVGRFKNDIRISKSGDLLSGRSYSYLISLSEEATEWALVRESRPNCTIILPVLSPFHWGGLVFFFEMATAIEGELLDVNAFDQPGVEGYKNYMYYKLKKTGLATQIKDEIVRNPLKKQARFII